MEKIADDMELDDQWDFLSDDGFVDVHQYEITTSPKGVFDMDYFSCRSPDKEIVKEVIKVGDQEMISPQHVSFKKETDQFVDMKRDSPKSDTKGIVPFIDTKEDTMDEEEEEKEDCVQDKKAPLEENGPSLNLWGWKLTGIGALCSIGMAAATVCIFVLGRSQQKPQHHLQNQKLRFQIYTDDKRFKQVVHHAGKLNQVVSSVRSGPFNRAQFTLGGYCVYDGV